MLRRLAALCLLTVAGACSHGYSAASSSTYGPAPTRIVATRGGQLPPGTVFTVKLDRPAKAMRVGDTVSGRVSEELLSFDGQVLLPRGAAVKGRVVAVAPGSTTIAFDSITMAGVRQPLAMRVVVQPRTTDVLVRLPQPIESLASLSYRRYY